MKNKEIEHFGKIFEPKTFAYLSIKNKLGGFLYKKSAYIFPRGEPRLELGVQVFGIIFEFIR